MRFSPTFTVTRSGASQATAIADGADTLVVRRKIVALKRAVEFYGLTGINDTTPLGRSLLVDYDRYKWSHASIRSALIALESTIARPEDSPPIHHFDWPLLHGSEDENDLELVAATNSLTPKALLARLTRRTYVIEDFSMPTMSPELFPRHFPQMLACHHPHAVPRRVPRGTLTLGNTGFSIKTSETMTQDLVHRPRPAALRRPGAGVLSRRGPNQIPPSRAIARQRLAKSGFSSNRSNHRFGVRCKGAS
jgi:hypothetical protein